MSVEERRGGFVCGKCWLQNDFFDVEATICRKCGRKMAGTVSSAERENVFCRQCDTDFYDAARAVGEYENALRASIIQLKTKPFISEILAEKFLKAFQNAPFDSVSKIIPVPLSTQRRKERGFNQAVVIARRLSNLTGLPLDEISLRRNLNTDLYRAGADAVERRKSVAKAFEVARPRLIKDQTILLIDDVFTSGATVSSCAETLKSNGASKVFVLTLARAALRLR